MASGVIAIRLLRFLRNKVSKSQRSGYGLVLRRRADCVFARLFVPSVQIGPALVLLAAKTNCPLVRMRILVAEDNRVNPEVIEARFLGWRRMAWRQQGRFDA